MIELVRNVIFHLFISKPFDPKQILVLLLVVSGGIYLSRMKVRFLRIAGKILAIFGILVLFVRIAIVLYLATQA